MKSFCLASGSSGNCWYIESKKGVKILVDCGLSFLKIKEILFSRNIKIEDLDAIFLTHEHSDHIIGLDLLLKNLKLDIFISKSSINNFLKNKDNLDFKCKINYIKNHEVVNFGDLRVFVLEKPHDVDESLSFVFENNGKKIGIFTDLGHVPDSFYHILNTCDVLYFETNYCEQIISNKKNEFNQIYLHRLMSNFGHLSINQACNVLSKVCNDNQKIILSHISENTNSYENSYLKVKNFLAKEGKFPKIYVSFQNSSSDWF